MRPHQVIKPTHYCGTTCIIKGGAPYCTECGVYVFLPNGIIDLDLSDPEPPRAA